MLDTRTDDSRPRRATPSRRQRQPTASSSPSPRWSVSGTSSARAGPSRTASREHVQLLHDLSSPLEAAPVPRRSHSRSMGSLATRSPTRRTASSADRDGAGSASGQPPPESSKLGLMETIWRLPQVNLRWPSGCTPAVAPASAIRGHWGRWTSPTDWRAVPWSGRRHAHQASRFRWSCDLPRPPAALHNRGTSDAVGSGSGRPSSSEAVARARSLSSCASAGSRWCATEWTAFSMGFPWPGATVVAR
jgi:hypothetical protein